MPSRKIQTTGLLSLSVHDELNSTFAGVQLALHSDVFPGSYYEDVHSNIDNNDRHSNVRPRPYLFLVEVRAWDKINRGNSGRQFSTAPAGYEFRTSFTIAVTKESLRTIKENSRTQISLLKNVADLYKLSPYDMVTLSKIPAEDEERELAEICAAEFVTVSTKDQFVSRGDLYYFHNEMIGKWLYEGMRMQALSLRANINEIRKGTDTIKLGIVTENTKITVRSRSARIIWLVQISTEMWDYASPYETARKSQHGGTEGICQIYFDKFVRFMMKVFERWKDIEVCINLQLTISSLKVIA